jgi:hypothetical protein
MQWWIWVVKLYSAQAALVTCTNEPGTFFSKSAQKCTPCPRGLFSASNTCVKCPVGKYSNRSGVASVLDCELCAPGTYQTVPGGIFCDGTCPDGTYSTKWGSDSRDDCKTCPRGLASYQCGFDISTVHKPQEDPQTSFYSSMFGDSKPKRESQNACGRRNNVCMTKHIQ